MHLLAQVQPRCPRRAGGGGRDPGVDDVPGAGNQLDKAARESLTGDLNADLYRCSSGHHRLESQVERAASRLSNPSGIDTSLPPLEAASHGARIRCVLAIIRDFLVCTCI